MSEPANEVTVNNRPVLFNEKTTYLPLMLVLGVMGTLVVGVYNVSQYVASQRTANSQAVERHLVIQTSLAQITVRQDALQRDIAQLRVDLNELRVNDWNITDMLSWCRETEALNAAFKCPAQLRRQRIKAE